MISVREYGMGGEVQGNGWEGNVGKGRKENEGVRNGFFY